MYGFGKTIEYEIINQTNFIKKLSTDCFEIFFRQILRIKRGSGIVRSIGLSRQSRVHAHTVWCRFSKGSVPEQLPKIESFNMITPFRFADDIIARKKKNVKKKRNFFGKKCLHSQGNCGII